MHYPLPPSPGWCMNHFCSAAPVWLDRRSRESNNWPKHYVMQYFAIIHVYVIIIMYMYMLHARTGGRVVNSWSSECTHLVMTNLNVTIKVNTVYYMYMYVLQMCNFKYIIL